VTSAASGLALLWLGWQLQLLAVTRKLVITVKTNQELHANMHLFNDNFNQTFDDWRHSDLAVSVLDSGSSGSGSSPGWGNCVVF